MKKSMLVLACSLLLLLSACSSGTAADNSTGNNSKLQKVTIMLDWYPNAVHSFLYTALEKGYFKQEGLDVNIEMPADTNDPLRLVAAGKIDLALTYEPDVIIARDENIPVKSIAAIVRHPLNTLMVPANGPIKSPKDLAGKTVGYPSITLDQAIVNTMVKTDGGDPGKVKMVDVGWDLIPAMATERVDALIGGYINHEELLLDKEGHPMKAFSPTKYGVPDYYELVLVTSDNELKQNPQVLKKFMAAAAKGQAYVQAHPAEGLNILLNHEAKTNPLDKGVETKSLQILLPLMDAKGKPFGYQDPASWQKVAKWLYDNKVIKNQSAGEEAFANLS